RRRGGAGTRGELAERGDARARSGGARATRGRGRQARRRARGLREARWRAVKRLALAASLALAAACTNEKAESLRAEIAKLGKDRIEAGGVREGRQAAADAAGPLGGGPAGAALGTRAPLDEGSAPLARAQRLAPGWA